MFRDSQACHHNSDVHPNPKEPVKFDSFDELCKLGPCWAKEDEKGTVCDLVLKHCSSPLLESLNKGSVRFLHSASLAAGNDQSYSDQSCKAQSSISRFGSPLGCVDQNRNLRSPRLPVAC